MFDKQYLKRAIELSRRALDQAGAGPFGSVVVRDGKIVGEGFNQAVMRCDPTSHSEVEAIRDACGNLRTLDLSGSELYTSCEPCPMCVTTIMMARVSKIYYAASLAQSGQAFASLPKAFSIDEMRRQTALPIEQRDLPSEQQLDAEAVAVLETWVTKKALA